MTHSTEFIANFPHRSAILRLSNNVVLLVNLSCFPIHPSPFLKHCPALNVTRLPWGPGCRCQMVIGCDIGIGWLRPRWWCKKVICSLSPDRSVSNWLWTRKNIPLDAKCWHRWWGGIFRIGFMLSPVVDVVVVVVAAFPDLVNQAPEKDSKRETRRNYKLNFIVVNAQSKCWTWYEKGFHKRPSKGKLKHIMNKFLHVDSLIFVFVCSSKSSSFCRFDNRFKDACTNAPKDDWKSNNPRTRSLFNIAVVIIIKSCLVRGNKVVFGGMGPNISLQMIMM